jgi:hypothetical protein
MKIGAGETDLRFGSFSSFRRKPESSNIKDEIRCLHNYGLISNMFGKRYPTQHGTITLYEINKKLRQL